MNLQKQAVGLIFCARSKSHYGKLFKLAKMVPATELYNLEGILQKGYFLDSVAKIAKVSMWYISINIP